MQTVSSRSRERIATCFTKPNITAVISDTTSRFRTAPTTLPSTSPRFGGVSKAAAEQIAVKGSVFDVSIQGETVLSDYDIYAEAGSLTATTETIEGVEATDGVISISSTTQADNTKFSGIEIHQTDGEGQAGLNPAQTIRMDGDREGWEATSPQDIAGQTNPTLTLREGEEYTVTWTNVDGTPHNFVVQDGDGESLTETEIVGDEGAIRTLTFTASEEMAQYICTVHPSSMVGDIEIVDAGE